MNKISPIEFVRNRNGKFDKYVLFHPITKSEVDRVAKRKELERTAPNELMPKSPKPTSSSSQHRNDCTCEKCRRFRIRNPIKNETAMYYKMIGNVALIRAVLESHGYRHTSKDNFSILWTSSHIKSNIFQKLSKYQKINTFPKSYECTRKDHLCRNINRMIQLHGKKNFRFMPLCFVYPEERQQIEESFLRNPGIPWIVKPAASCQGKGIYITDNFGKLPDYALRMETLDNWIVEKCVRIIIIFAE